jgi:hypothetical protein
MCVAIDQSKTLQRADIAAARLKGRGCYGGGCNIMEKSSFRYSGEEIYVLGEGSLCQTATNVQAVANIFVVSLWSARVTVFRGMPRRVAMVLPAQYRKQRYFV